MADSNEISDLMPLWTPEQKAQFCACYSLPTVRKCLNLHDRLFRPHLLHVSILTSRELAWRGKFIELKALHRTRQIQTCFKHAVFHHSCKLRLPTYSYYRTFRWPENVRFMTTVAAEYTACCFWELQLCWAGNWNDKVTYLQEFDAHLYGRLHWPHYYQTWG
jgi:hypothetical protein